MSATAGSGSAIGAGGSAGDVDDAIQFLITTVLITKIIAPSMIPNTVVAVWKSSSDCNAEASDPLGISVTVVRVPAAASAH